MALAAATVAVSAPVAQASHEDDTFGDASCTLLPGVAGTAEAPGENGVNGALSDTTFGGGWDPVTRLLDTDPGHFNFSGQALCEGADIASEQGEITAPGGGHPSVVPPTIVDIVASGDYDNLICGTGTANGDARLTDATGTDLLGQPIDIQIYSEFGITFAAGVGVLSLVIDADETGTNNGGGQWDTAPDGAENWPTADITYGGHSYVVDSSGLENQIDGGNGLGVIDILPIEGDCASNVTEFEVNGAFDASLSGEGSRNDPNEGPDSDI
jgi:hypothetical protein